MEVTKLMVSRIFDSTERLDAPLFQRPYVWDECRNWEPLWEAIESLANKRVDGSPVRPHFLGTVVLEMTRTPPGRVHMRQIIDGQQRLTTLQLALAAARDIARNCAQHNHEQAFRKLTENNVPLSTCTEDIFKVWPTNADREDFRAVTAQTSSATSFVSVLTTTPNSTTESCHLTSHRSKKCQATPSTRGMSTITTDFFKFQRLIDKWTLTYMRK